MNLTETQRRWAYGIVIAALPLLAAYGILGPDQAPMWVALAAAVLGVSSSSLAAANVGVEPEAYTGKHRAED
ncbi:hypothetical protein [Dietzia sp. ANT_WB102]|uniref:phage holin n=1 Tax=Dietzia sp. ANT_WB102 TaxID=2597345 RepID=UPI0011ECB54E|nr:hypothetical protein [Dietzia sp. ANT_WB102]KAA0916473.1 hypothetical protein FQ137_14730 [Dietzia sp. ANT_WB102]